MLDLLQSPRLHQRNKSSYMSYFNCNFRWFLIAELGCCKCILIGKYDMLSAVPSHFMTSATDRRFTLHFVVFIEDSTYYLGFLDLREIHRSDISNK